MSTTIQQATKTLMTFLTERLGQSINQSQGNDHDFILMCREKVEDFRIADLVEEYYRGHADLRLVDFSRIYLSGQLKERGEWSSTITISNFSKQETGGQILVTVNQI